MTPVFSTHELEHELSRLALDDSGLWRPLETLLPKGIPVAVDEIFKNNLCKITTSAYPSSISLYTHLSYLTNSQTSLHWKKPSLPSLETFLSRINECLKRRVPYLWGGTTPTGTRSLCNLYSCLYYVRGSVRQRIATLRGLDCSGLIYWATRGATGRNTSDLLYEGTAVKIRGLSTDAIINLLKPGMLVVWKGHVLVVTKEGIVDSTPEKGVSLTSTSEKIREIRSTRIPIDSWPKTGNPPDLSFVVRDLYSSRT